MEEALSATQFSSSKLTSSRLVAGQLLCQTEGTSAAARMKETLKAYPKDLMAPQVQTTLTRIKEVLTQK